MCAIEACHDGHKHTFGVQQTVGTIKQPTYTSMCSHLVVPECKPQGKNKYSIQLLYLHTFTGGPLWPPHSCGADAIQASEQLATDDVGTIQTSTCHSLYKLLPSDCSAGATSLISKTYSLPASLLLDRCSPPHCSCRAAIFAQLVPSGLKPLKRKLVLRHAGDAFTPLLPCTCCCFADLLVTITTK